MNKFELAVPDLIMQRDTSKQDIIRDDNKRDKALFSCEVALINSKTLTFPQTPTSTMLAASGDL